MPDMTAQQVITSAYRKNGIKSPNTDQSTDGLQDLQNMMASWSAEGLIVPYYTTENFTLTIGQAVYTIGVSGDSPDLVSVTGRPLRIVNAFIRITNDDYGIRVNMTKSQYNALVSKDTTARPRRLYYDPQYPLGKIKFEYEADVAYDFHIVSEKPLIELTALTTALSLPREVNRALVYNLAIELAPDNDNKLPPEVFLIAASSKDTLENINAIEQLSDPVALDRAIVGRGGYMDITSGDYV